MTLVSAYPKATTSRSWSTEPVCRKAHLVDGSVKKVLILLNLGLDIMGREKETIDKWLISCSLLKMNGSLVWQVLQIEMNGIIKKEENNSMNNVPPVFKVQHTFSVWEVLVIKKFNPYNKKEDQVSWALEQIYLC